MAAGENNPNLQLTTASDCLALWRAGNIESRFGPLRDQKALVLGPDQGVLNASDRCDLLDCLAQMPCPTIGIEADKASPLSAALDVIVADEDKAALILSNVEARPLAATTLVQLLRATASLSPEHALTMESLAYGALQAGSEHKQWLQSQPLPSVSKEDSVPILTSRDDGTLLLELNRPAQRNAISVAMRDALVEALTLATVDTSIDAIEIRGRGSCFSVGGDVQEFGLAFDAATAHAVRSLALPARRLLRVAGKTTAFVHSACIGAGIEFPAFAGRIVADRKSFFKLPELAMGVIPGAGGCVSIPRRIGRQKTAWMVLSGRRVNAAQALEWGLVDEVTEVRPRNGSRR